MRTVTYRLADLEKKVSIHIGRLGENEVTRVQIDAGSLFAEYPNAVASMSVENPEGVKYPATVTRDGDMVIWDVRDSDLAKAGHGEIQWTFTENGAILKSAIARTSIGRSIVGDGTPPDPLEDWIEHAEDVLEQVEHAFPTGGTKGQVLAKASDADFDTEWTDQTGGGGTGDYEDLENLPKIAGVELKGDKSLHDLGAAAESDIPDVSGFYTKPGSGIPASDLADGVIPDVSGFYTKPAGGIPASDLADGVIPDVSGFYTKPSGGIPASDIADGVIPDPEDLIDDTAGAGDTEKVWSADKSAALLSAIHQVTPEQFGAKGDGVTDDSQAVQDAVDAGYAVYFGSNKTYYLASTVTIDHDCHLFGGENTVIKTKTPTGGIADNGIVIAGTLKKTTTLTTDYSSAGETANCNNKFTLADMTGIEIGDIIHIVATDQYYHYARQYYYLGATMLITDIYDGHIFTSDYMPWDIENTENVSVTIYSAPVAIVEGINFVSDTNSIGSYRYLLSLRQCKNSTVMNCTFRDMANGIMTSGCVNTKIECVRLAKSKYDNTLSGDGYGIVIEDSTNTIIERVIATCAQHSVAITGTYGVTMHTFVRNCEFTAECRSPGFDTHENTYDLVIEDSVLGTAVLNATCILNRCKVFTNRRNASTGVDNIGIYGSHVPERSDVRFYNVEFNGASVIILRSSGQDPIQAYDNVFGNIVFDSCKGGFINLDLSATEMCLSNTINNLEIRNWKDCKEIYNPGTGKIKRLYIVDSTFTDVHFINNHRDEYATSNVEYLEMKGIDPISHKLMINRDTRGMMAVLPKGVKIALSSNNQSAKFVVCGSNITPNNNEDMAVGSVTGSTGSALGRTVATGSNIPSVAFDQSGNLVYTQGSNTAKYAVYPVGMVYANKFSKISISAKVKNTGETSAEAFRPYVATVDTKTGLILKRISGDSVTATQAGADMSYEYTVNPGCIAMAYISCATAVSGAETTFENFEITLKEDFAPVVPGDEYEAHRITGNGTVLSLEGVNNIMCSDLDFHVNLQADLNS